MQFDINRDKKNFKMNLNEKMSKNIYNIEKFIMLFTGIFIFKILLDLSYFYVISPIWSYSKLITDFNFIKEIESFLMIFVILLIVPKNSYKLSELVIQIFFIISYIPFTTFYAFTNSQRLWFYTVTFFWVLVILLSKLFKIKVEYKSLKEAKFIKFLIIGFAIFIIFRVILKLENIEIKFTLGSEVYDIRKEFNKLNISFIERYILSWIAKVINPLLILYFFWKTYDKKDIKSFSLFFLFLFLQLVLFSITGHKFYLFIIPFVIFFSLFIKKKNFLINFLVIMCGIIIFCFIVYLSTNSILPAGIIIRRGLIVPAQLSFYYYDFFKEKPLYLSHSIFKIFIKYPFNLPPPNLIGAVYFNNPFTNANNGIPADGFINFGFLGVTLWAIIFVFLLKISDNIVKYTNSKIFYPMFIVSFLNTLNSALLTSILTHGLIILYIIAYLSVNKIKEC